MLNDPGNQRGEVPPNPKPVGSRAGVNLARLHACAVKIEAGPKNAMDAARMLLRPRVSAHRG